MLRPVIAVGALSLPFTACAGDEPGDFVDSAFCEDVRDRSELFVAEGPGEVPATLVGALRELVADSDAPDELRDAYEQLTEATSDEDLDEALAQVEETITRCGVDTDG